MPEYQAAVKLRQGSGGRFVELCNRGPESARIAYARALARADRLGQSIGILSPMVQRAPELWVDLVGLLLQKTIRQPADERKWPEFEGKLREAEKALPEAVESLTLLRLDVLAAQGRLKDARAILSSVQAKDPRNLRYRLAQARLTQRDGVGRRALQVLDQAEKELGASPDIQLARLDYWGREGSVEAKTAVAKLAESRGQVSDAGRPVFLEGLAAVAIRLGDPNLARQYWRELAGLEPDNVRVLLGLFNLAMGAADHADAQNLVNTMRKVEGQQGTSWRFAQAALLIDQARRAESTARQMTRADINAIRTLASEIAEQRPDWWGGPLLLAEIAELDGREGDIVASYLRSVDLGNSQPAIIRHVIGLLSDRHRFADIDRLVSSLRERGIAAEDVAISTAFDAIRKKDYERGLALARQVIPAKSTRFSDHLSLGRILMTSGKVEAAAKEFRLAVELAPSIPETWRSWVEYLARTNQGQAATQAAASAEKALSAAGSALRLAQCHWTAGEASKAAGLFRQAIRDRPHDAATLRLAATFFLDQNDPDRAEPLVAELVKPETRASQADLAWARRSQIMLGFASGVTPERVEHAINLVEADLKSDPGDFDAQRMRAVLLSMQFSQRKQSIQALESIDRADQLAPRERFLLATLYSAERNWPKCQSEMRIILESSPRQPRYMVFYVNLMTRLGELDEAENWLRTLKPLLSADPTGMLVQLEARLLKARKRDRDLAALIRNYVERNPDQTTIGACLFERFGLLKEAEQVYRADLTRNSGDPATVLLLVEFLARQDRPQEALDLCEPGIGTWRPEAVALASLAIFRAKSATEPQRRKAENWLVEKVHQKPDDVVLNTKLAALRGRQGNYAEAEATYRRVLSATRDNVEALNGLAWQLALQNKRCEEALSLVDRAIDIAGPNPTLLDTRSVALMRSGQGDKAVETLLEAVSSQSEQPIHYFHLARAYHITNAPLLARQALERSEALGLTEKTLHPLERETYRMLHQEIALR